MNEGNEQSDHSEEEEDDIFQQAVFAATLVAGWEGTAHDARVFDQALTNVNFNFPHPPPGKYYLVDSGYPTPIGYIGPYRCEQGCWWCGGLLGSVPAGLSVLVWVATVDVVFFMGGMEILHGLMATVDVIMYHGSDELLVGDGSGLPIMHTGSEDKGPSNQRSP
ncbi:hypothetical protein P8452_17160 [Trifolium repens]|nr:hypothetical protein P8452_17160 [Trifolium repens]